MLGLSAHFPYLADLAEFRRQAEWKFLHYGNQLRQQGSVGGQSPDTREYHWVSSPQVGVKWGDAG